MRDIQEISNTIDKIPPFSQAVLRAMALPEDADVPATKVVEVIQYDPIITLRVLQICNSAAFGLPQEVDSLQHALVILGNHDMMRILATSGALDFLDGEWGGYGLQNGELWEHAIACSLMSQVLLTTMGMDEDHALFTGALLHDVGKIVLSQYAEREYKEIVNLVENQDYSSLEAENKIIGIDHAEVGSLLGERWQLPQNIVSIIRHHHDPVNPANDPMPLCLAHLANLLCIQMGIGTGNRGLASRSAPDLVEALGWSTETLDACISSAWSKFEQAKDIVGISREKAKPNALGLM
jgi:putative nucleotidyltransferase with HDIG domain